MMELKIIITCNLSVDDDLDLEDLAQEIKDENFLETSTIGDIVSIDDVLIAKKKYTIQADNDHIIGKLN